MPSLPTPSPEFRRWLRQGRGLAILRAAEVPQEEARESLFDACTHFTGYDFQCEGPRAEYLFDALVAAGALGSLEARLLEALEQRTGADREQLLDLVVLLSLAGSDRAGQALREHFVRHAGEAERSGATQMIRVFGLPGLVEVARELGRRSGVESAGDEELAPSAQAERIFGALAVKACLAAGALRDPDVRSYLRSIRAASGSASVGHGEARAAGPTLELTFAALRAGVLEEGSTWSRWRSRTWGRKAPDAELALAIDALRGPLPKTLRLAILVAINARKLAAPSEPLWAAVHSGDPALVGAGWMALGYVRSPAVRSKAREALSGPAPDVRALRGLIQSFGEEDVSLLLGLLARTKDEDALHEVEKSILDAVDAGAGAYVAPILHDLYARGACGLCRGSVVTAMKALGVLTPEIRAECIHDCDLDLRATARTWLGEASAS